MQGLSKKDLSAAQSLFTGRIVQVAGILLLIVLGALSGCASRRPAASPPTPASPPSSPPPRANAPTPVRRDVAILYSDAAGFTEVANQLRKLLPLDSYRLTVIDVEAPNSQASVNALRNRAGLYVVAIGLPAARIARDRLTAPVIFSQVFNYQELMAGGRAMRGVAAMPPLDIQVQDWKKLDPKLRRVGLIVSSPHKDLIAQAERAGLKFIITRPSRQGR